MHPHSPQIIPPARAPLCTAAGWRAFRSAPRTLRRNQERSARPRSIDLAMSFARPRARRARQRQAISTRRCPVTGWITARLRRCADAARSRGRAIRGPAGSALVGRGGSGSYQTTPGAACSPDGITAPGPAAASGSNLICASSTWQYVAYTVQSAAAAAQRAARVSDRHPYGRRQPRGSEIGEGVAPGACA